MSIQSQILEGLANKNLNENNKYSDLPMVSDTRKLQKLISQKLTERYQKLFKSIGSMGVDVDVYVGKDSKSGIDGVIKTLGVSIVFDSMLTPESVKEVQNICKKYMVNYPNFTYEKSDNSFWFESDDYEEIIDIMDTIEHTDKVNLNKMYKVLSGDEVEDYCTSRNTQDMLDKKSMNDWFNSQRF